MTENQKLIVHFYTCFRNRDYKGMQACYADDATFSDPVFRHLNAAQVRAMWEMLIQKGKDLQIEFNGVECGSETGKAHWVANYTFSATGKKVMNKVDAFFEFKEGKISKHVDQFNFYTWARQALGTTGLILGWTSFLHRKISQQAMKNLSIFMGKK